MKLDIEQKSTLYEEGYKFCFYVIKLIIGGVILTGIMQDSIDRTSLYGWGLFFIFLLGVLGVYLIIKAKNKKLMNVIGFMGAITFMIVAAGLSFIIWDSRQEKKNA